MGKEIKLNQAVEYIKTEDGHLTIPVYNFDTRVVDHPTSSSVDKNSAKPQKRNWDGIDAWDGGPSNSK